MGWVGFSWPVSHLFIYAMRGLSGAGWVKESEARAGWKAALEVRSLRLTSPTGWYGRVAEVFQMNHPCNCATEPCQHLLRLSTEPSSLGALRMRLPLGEPLQEWTYSNGIGRIVLNEPSAWNHPGSLKFSTYNRTQGYLGKQNRLLQVT